MTVREAGERVGSLNYTAESMAVSRMKSLAIQDALRRAACLTSRPIVKCEDVTLWLNLVLQAVVRRGPLRLRSQHENPNADEGKSHSQTANDPPPMHTSRERRSQLGSDQGTYGNTDRAADAALGK